MMFLDSIVSVLVSALIILAFLALLTKVIPKGVAIFLVLLWLFVIIHPRLRAQVLSVIAALIVGLLPLLVILLGLRILISGKMRRGR